MADVIRQNIENECQLQDAVILEDKEFFIDEVSCTFIEIYSQPLFKQPNLAFKIPSSVKVTTSLLKEPIFQ